MNKIKEIACLHFISQDDVEGRSHPDQILAACKAGVKWIQFRSKAADRFRIKREAIEARKITTDFGCTLIINDFVDMAYEIGAEGVHLGKNDMKIEEARKILGNEFVVGATANSPEDVERLSHLAVDYIGLGPYRYTTNKKDLAPVLPYTSLKEIIQLAGLIPVILIGGVIHMDIHDILSTGAHGIAVSSAIAKAPSLEGSCRIFQNEFKEYAV
ncbi:MAG: thiamine phosphate synthase [Bacteroidota bacterium]|nr:thiamine phosphate synthase [Bacteroidota bacterium]